MLDLFLEQLQYSALTVASALIVFEFGLMDSSPLWFLVAAIVALYFWGCLVAWHVSVLFHSEFPQAYSRQTMLHYTAWFSTWFGAVGLLVWAAVLRDEARSDKQAFERIKQ